MSDREELDALRRLAELEAKAGGKPASAPAEPYDPTAPKNVIGAAVEPALAMLTGAVAQPVAGIAGLLNMAGNAVGATNSDPAETVRNTAVALTRTPKTEGGQRAAEVVGAPFELLASLADKLGGGVADATGSPLLGALTNAAAQVVPGSLLPGKGAVSKGSPSIVAEALAKRSRGLMQSALKPGQAAMKSGAGERAIQTLLDEGVNVTPGGLGKLEGRISTLNDQIAEAIANSKATVGKGDIAARVVDQYQKVMRQGDPRADMAATAGVFHRFTDHPLLPDQIPVQLAQEIKQGTYRSIGSRNYGETKGAALEAEKALARGAKEEIARAVPEVGPLNARDSALIEAKDLLESRVGTAGNKNPGGLSLLGQSPAQIAAMLLDRSEIVKSLLARAINPGKTRLPDEAALSMTAPQTFSEDSRARQALIDALINRR